jgi:hypothetical protein
MPVLCRADGSYPHRYESCLVSREPAHITGRKEDCDYETMIEEYLADEMRSDLNIATG